MTSERRLPYGAFNFVVAFDGDDDTFGGFSEVSGLGTEIAMADYRNGNDQVNHVSKVPGMHTVTDVTLRRGVVDSSALWTWINATQTTGPAAKKEVVSITLLDEARNAIQKWSLASVAPMRYTGPSFNASGGGEVAIEELVLSCEGFAIESP